MLDKIMTDLIISPHAVPDIPLIARLIDDTPAVDGTTVAVAFEANLPMESATCQIPGSEIETQDCRLTVVRSNGYLIKE